MHGGLCCRGRGLSFLSSWYGRHRAHTGRHSCLPEAGCVIRCLRSLRSHIDALTVRHRRCDCAVPPARARTRRRPLRPCVASCHITCPVRGEQQLSGLRRAGARHARPVLRAPGRPNLLPCCAFSVFFGWSGYKSNAPTCQERQPRSHLISLSAQPLHTTPSSWFPTLKLLPR